MSLLSILEMGHWHTHAPRREATPANLHLPSTSETDLSREHSFSCRECGRGRRERHVVNNRCETTCTSRCRPPLDNAATRRRWGRGENTASCPADNLQSHRPPSRPTGQASWRPGQAHDRGRPSVKCELK